MPCLPSFHPRQTPSQMTYVVAVMNSTVFVYMKSPFIPLRPARTPFQVLIYRCHHHLPTIDHRCSAISSNHTPTFSATVSLSLIADVQVSTLAHTSFECPRVQAMWMTINK